MASKLTPCLRFVVTALAVVLSGSGLLSASDAARLDLADAAIVVVGDEALPANAAALLSDEVEKRTGVRLPIVGGDGEQESSTIVIQTVSQLADNELPDGLERPAGADAYAIWIDRSQPQPQVMLLGYDGRASLFAAGRLLRLLAMSPGKLSLPADVRLSTAPDVAIRGHQLGYRDSANSYDGWDPDTYEQYIRDLIVFGANAIELIPALTPEEERNSHMPLGPWEMNQKLSALIGEYGLDVWMWVPVHGDVEDPEQAAAELDRRRELFQSCSHIDDIFVPGGDPGDTPPEILLPWLEQLADVLHESHPEAGLWVSNQGFTTEQNEIFFGYLRTNEPDWLEGVVFGPWAKISLAEARARTPRQFQVRRYPDICHTVRCQYPVPDWDPAFAHWLGREPYNPRPRAMALIHNSMAALADGFATYSDGVTDDVNKVVWSACGWDSDQPVEETLAEYGRYFIDGGQGEAIAEGLLALEDNWKGPLATNENLEKTLALWQQLEQQLPEAAKSNWRLQLPLLRAYYDAYLKQRLIRHTEIEQQALGELRKAPKTGPQAAIDAARRVLAQVESDETAQDLRTRLVELGRSLHKTISMQLDTPNYHAANPERGAVLDFLDFPLNDRPWLEAQFAAILKLDDEQEQLRRIDRIVNWEDPGPGGYYDDLGHVGRQPHLLPPHRDQLWNADPGYVGSPQSEFSLRIDRAKLTLYDDKLSWLNQAETLFGTPLRMRYSDLDPAATYRLRVTYAGRFHATMRLTAGQRHEVHGPLPQSSETWPAEFAIPHEATADGILDLQWELVEQRGCQVAEVWLIKE